MCYIRQLSSQKVTHIENKMFNEIFWYTVNYYYCHDVNLSEPGVMFDVLKLRFQNYFLCIFQNYVFLCMFQTILYLKCIFHEIMSVKTSLQRVPLLL